METKKVHLGLDLGIASVGWSLVDSEQNIIASGSHLFKQLSDPATDFETVKIKKKENKKEKEKAKKRYGEGVRGEKRRARRALNRKKQRRLDFLNTIDENCYNNQIKKKNKGKLSSLYNPEYQKIFGFTESESATDFLSNNAHKYNFYEIYHKGFQTELDPKELFLFLYQKLSLRGVFFKVYEKDEHIDYGYDHSLFKNVLEKQFSEKQKYRDKSNEMFSIYWNWQDIEFILKKCSYIKNNFIDDYKKIFFRHRSFAHGPGSINSLSKWGLEKKDYDPNSKKPKNGIALWDKKVGFCSISLSKNKGDKTISEKRLNNFYFIADLSHLISQLVYVKKNNEQLSYLDILKIINKTIFYDKELTGSLIAKWLDCDHDNLTGIPLDQDKKTEKLNQILKLRKYFNDSIVITDKNNFNIADNWENLCFIDEIRFSIIKNHFEYSKETNKWVYRNIDLSNYEEKLKKGKEIEKFLEDNLAGQEINFQINKDKFFHFDSFDVSSESELSGTRKYGKEAYKDHLKNFFNENKTETFSEYHAENIRSSKIYLYQIEKFKKYFPLSMFNEQEFLSPNVKNTLKETLRVINTVLRRYIYKSENNYELKSIIIETTWDTSNLHESLQSLQRKQNIIIYQKWRTNLIDEAKNKLIESKLIHGNKENIPSDHPLVRKYILWKEQGEKDFYVDPDDQKSILRINDLVDCDIDHIIPKSISWNSFEENLVVTRKNKDKGQKTPYEYLNNDLFNKLKTKLWKPLLDPDKKDVPKNYKNIPVFVKKMRKKKFKFLILEEKENIGFTNTNLSETTYAIRKLKEGLTFYIEEIKNIFENGQETEKKLISNDGKIYDNFFKICDLRTINGQLTSKLRNWINNPWIDEKNLLLKKDRKIKSHHACDATLIAIYSSINCVNKWYDYKKNLGHKLYYLENATPAPNYKKLEEIFSDKNNNFLSKINEALNPINKKFYYSFKPHKLFCWIKTKNNKNFYIKKSSFYKLSVEEQLNKIKQIDIKQIFDNENFIGYREIKNEGISKKYRLVYFNLLSDKKEKNKKIFQYFNLLHNKIKTEKLNKNFDFDSCIKKFCDENYIYTDFKIIKKLYELIIEYKSDSFFSDSKNAEKNVFKEINSKLKNLINNLDSTHNQDLNIFFNKNYINDFILDNYVLIIDKPDLNCWKLIKIKKIKFLEKSKDSKSKKEFKLKQFNPTFELEQAKINERNENKFIFNPEIRKILSKNKSLYGEVLKMIALIQYYDYEKKNERKISFFKINELNKIVREPKNGHILHLIHPKSWFFYNNNLWRIRNMAIGSNQIVLKCESDEYQGDITFSNISPKKDKELLKKILIPNENLLDLEEELKK